MEIRDKRGIIYELEADDTLACEVRQYVKMKDNVYHKERMSNYRYKQEYNRLSNLVKKGINERTIKIRQTWEI